MIEQSLTLPNGAVIRNRIAKAAMSEVLADPWGAPSDALIALYRLWGKSGAGVLTTGHSAVDAAHLEQAGNLVFDGLGDQARFRDLAAAGRSDGATFLAQLCHSGRQTPASITPNPLSISDEQLAKAGYGKPVEATPAQLQAIVRQFHHAAQVAIAAGFDGVQVHAAHGYLLSSSLSGRINTRTDAYGGPLANRMRLPLEVVAAVRAAIGPARVLSVKINSADFQRGGFSADDSVAVAQELERAGVDMIEVSGGTFESPVAYSATPPKESAVKREAFFLEYAERMKRELSVPVQVTGGFRTRALMEQALREGAVDLIGLARPFIAEPRVAAKLIAGELQAAPALERWLTETFEIPDGGVLDWFSHQLAVLARTGEIDKSVSPKQAQAALVDAIARNEAARVDPARRATPAVV